MIISLNIIKDLISKKKNDTSTKDKE